MTDLLTIAIPLLPLAAAAATGFDLLSGQRLSEVAMRRLCQGALALSFLLCAVALAEVALGPGSREITVARWIESGDYRVDLRLLVDPLSATMALLTTGFGLLVVRFAGSYMHREAGFGRFHAVLCLFIAAMLVLVMGGNLVLTFVGWEGAGLCSYLLIGYHRDRAGPARAATRAFVFNRIGDAGFLAAIFLVFRHFGTVDYATFLPRAHAMDASSATAICLCLLVAAAAKSGQLPFSPWLARAMEGPTPSSALFYAAVMVNAGVYLLVRARLLYAAAPAAGEVVALVGAATAIYAGITSLSQTDVKGSLIFSTALQLGLMFLACGLGAHAVAMVHLIAHASMRCFQFLTAPSILLGTRPAPAEAGEPASERIPPGSWLVLFGALSIVALPLTSIGHAGPGSEGSVLLIAAVGTALFCVAHIAARFAERGPRRSGAPFLIALAVAAAGIGLGLSTSMGEPPPIERLLGPAGGAAPASSGQPLLLAALVALFAALLTSGWLSAIYLHRAQPERRSTELFRLRRLHTIGLHRFWLDEVYNAFIVGPLLRLGRALDRFDTSVVDRAAGGSTAASRRALAAPSWEEALLAGETQDGGAAGAARAMLESSHRHGARHGETEARRRERAARPSSGLAGGLVEGLSFAAKIAEEHVIRRAAAVAAWLMDWLSSMAEGVEEHLVARALGRGIPGTGKILGRALGHADDLFERPLVAGALVAVSLLALIRWSP